jgi:hypothetical protein
MCFVPLKSKSHISSENLLLDKHIVNNGMVLFTTLVEKLFVTEFEMSFMTLFAWVLKIPFV